MRILGQTKGTWLLAIILGLAGTSCTTQRSAVLIKNRKPTQKVEAFVSKEPDATAKVKAQAVYSQLPLHFEPNQGQTDEQVKFLSRGNGYSLFLTSSEAVLALHKPEPKAKGKRQRAKGKREEQEKTDLAKLETRNSKLETVVRMKLVGANPNPQVVGLDELPGKSNYFIGNDPQNWHTNIPTYAKVQYRDIYPGIDLIYYGNQRQLEYDFVIAPGADPKVIQLAFDGLPPHPVPLVAQPSWLRAGWKPAPLGERGPMPGVFAPSPLAGEGQDGGRSRSPLRIDDNGDLILHTAGGEIHLHKPRIYQEIGGVKHPVPGGYVLLKPRTSNLEPQQVSFQVSAYDTSRPIIIDPVLSYSTYLGGSKDDEGFGIAVDADGNAYVTGTTSSTDFPTASPLQAALSRGTCTSFGGFTRPCFDVFVTKLNAAGSALVYSTYLGGRKDDVGSGIAVDVSGNAYVTGSTESTNFPTSSPLQAALGRGSDAFVAKLNAVGSALVYSTYLGGTVLYVLGDRSRFVDLVNTKTNQQGRIEAGQDPVAIAFSPDGTKPTLSTMGITRCRSLTPPPFLPPRLAMSRWGKRPRVWRLARMAPRCMWPTSWIIPSQSSTRIRSPWK